MKKCFRRRQVKYLIFFFFFAAVPSLMKVRTLDTFQNIKGR